MNELETLRAWARGDFYPLTPVEQGRNALDDLMDEMQPHPELWWAAYRALLPDVDRGGALNLSMPFARLLHVGGEALRAEVAEAARSDRKLANVFWDAMEDLRLPAEAYMRLGRQMTLEAFIRHVPRISGRPGKWWPEQWEDGWSGDAIFYLVENDPDEVRELGRKLLAASSDPGWASVIDAFIFEDLPEGKSPG